MTLKELRASKGLTQKEAAAMAAVPLRTYARYENDSEKADSIKYKYICDAIESACRLDEDHGVLAAEEIKAVCSDVFSAYPVDYCYLFGSYAKGTAGASSDVDLLVATDITGLQFYGLVERLREALKKRTDVLNLAQLEGNPELLNDILKYGVRIYEQHQG